MKARPGSFVGCFSGRRPVFLLLTIVLLVTNLGLAACGDFTPTSVNSGLTSPGAPTTAAVTMPTTGPKVTATPFATTTPSGPTPVPVDLPGGLQFQFNLPPYTGHVFSILATAFSPDQSFIATGGVEGVVRLWDTGKITGGSAGKMLATMSGHTGEVDILAFSPDGKFLASGGGSRGSGSDFSIRLWEVPSGKSVAILKGHSAGISCLQFSPDGHTLASASDDGTIKLWDLSTGKIKATLQSRAASIVFSPDGKTLAASDYDVIATPKGSYNLKFWDSATGQPVTSITLSDRAVAIAYSPDSKKLAAVLGNDAWTGYQRNLVIYDIASGKEQTNLKMTGFSIRHLTFSPDGKTLLGGGFRREGAPTISPFDGEPLDIYMITDLQGPLEGVGHLWDVAGGTELKSWTVKDSTVGEVEFDPTGQPLAVGVSDNSAHLWDFNSGKLLAGFEGAPAIRTLAYSPDGKLLATGQSDGSIHLRQAGSGQDIAVLRGHTAQVSALAFSPDSKGLASGGFDYQIKLWDLSLLPGEMPRLTATLKGHRSWVNSLSFSPDGKSLASASSDSLVKLWDTATGQERFTLKSHPYSVWAVVFTPDGQTLLSAGKGYYKGNGKSNQDENNTIKLWDTATGKLKGSLGETASVSALGLSPDGKIVAATTAGDYDNPGKLKLFDLAAGKELAALDLPDKLSSGVSEIEGLQFFLAFTPNGKTLVGGQSHGGITFWQLDAGTAKTTVKQIFHQATPGPDTLYTTALSPNGQTLAAGYADASLKSWFLVEKSPAVSPVASPAAATTSSPALAPSNPVPTVTAAPPGPAKPLALVQKYVTSPLAGHSAIVHQVAFSPDSKYLFSGDGRGLIIQWDLASHQEVKSFQSYRGYLALSKDGKILAANGPANDVLVWDVASGKQLFDLKGPQEMVRALAFSPDGKYLAAGGGNYRDSKDNSIRLWQLSDGKEVRRFDGNPKAVYYLAFHPDGKTIASGTYEGVIKFWDAATGKEKAQIQADVQEQMLGLTYSPDGNTVAVVSYTGWIGTYDTQTNSKKKTFLGHMYSGALAYSPDGQYIVTGDNNGNGVGEEQLIRFWSLDGTQIKTLPGTGIGVAGLAFSPDGQYLANGSEVGVSTPGDSDVYLWDVAAGKEAFVFKGGGRGAGVLYVSPDSKTFLAGVGAYTVKQYEVVTGKELNSISLPFLGDSTMSVSPDGKILAVLGQDKVIRLYDTGSGKEINTIYGQTTDRTAIRFSPDGKLLASMDFSGKNLKIHFWDVSSTASEEAGSLVSEGSSDIFAQPVFSPDGKLLAITTQDKSKNNGNPVIRLFDLATSQEIAQFTGHTYTYVSGLKFSPDGKYLLSSGWDDTIRLWDLARNKEVLTIKDIKYGGNAAVFGPDGKSIIAVTDDNFLDQWSIPDGKVLLHQPFKGYGLNFSPDGKFLLVSGFDGAVSAYEVKAG